MVMKSRVATGTFLLLSVFVSSCSSGKSDATGEGSPAAGGATKTVYTDNYPVAYFAERIGGHHVTVVFPAPKEGDPAFWEPGEKEIQAYQKADLILLNGAAFAKWADKASLPADRTVNTSLPFKDQFIEIKDAVTHSHGPSGQHSHAGTDFNTWVDPHFAKIQAGEIKKALTGLLPAHGEYFEKNLEALCRDLDSLDAGFRALVAEYEKEALVASHPVYNYVARRYGLSLKSMRWEPSEMPSEEEWADLAGILEKHPARWMLWEDEPDSAISDKLEKDHGVLSVVFSPCGNRPEKGDYLSVMKENIENLKAVFGGKR